MTKLKIRKITESDIDNGFLQTLDSLRAASNLDKKKAKLILRKINQNPDHLIFVAVQNGIVVGSITLIVEQKFIHNGGKVGHIEDVVVSKKHQGKGIGDKLVNFALKYAKKQGCYKTILDCDDSVMRFYEKIGFKAHSHGMRYDH